MSTDEICPCCEEDLCDCSEEAGAECPTDYYDPDDWGASWDDALDAWYNGGE